MDPSARVGDEPLLPSDRLAWSLHIHPGDGGFSDGFRGEVLVQGVEVVRSVFVFSAILSWESAFSDLPGRSRRSGGRRRGGGFGFSLVSTFLEDLEREGRPPFVEVEKPPVAVSEVELLLMPEDREDATSVGQSNAR